VRPGLKAALEAGVVRPLYAAGLGKADLRRLAKARGRSFADKPSQACLSSRLPMGMPVTRERLSKVEIVEGWLKDRGYLQLRARLDKDDLVRLEVAPAELPRLAADLADDTLREALLAEARAAGVTRVTLDLVGYHRAGEA
jgi:PP-loop superfamily ATP-utilizing enzyme